MKSIGKIFTAALAALIGLASCQKDDTLRYHNITMGNIVDGVFISDQGNRFNIREQFCKDIPDTLTRLMINCDVLEKTGEATYDIRLVNFSSVFTKAPVDSTAVTDPEVFVEDPLTVYEMWCSGGYINMYILIPVKIGSDTAHMINLVRDDEGAAAGVYEFTLKHNAFGEVAGSDEGSYALGGTYVSFPVAGMFKEDQADIVIHWNSAEKNPTDSEAENSRCSLTYKWEKGGYEHELSTKN